MALQVASLFGVLRMDDSQFKQSVKDAKSGMGDLSGRMQNVGGQMQRIGGSLTLAMAPAAAGLGVAVHAAMNFDESLTNTGAVLGLTREEINKMGAELLAIGGNTREGPQAVADAMYDISGGVADASTHMAILNAAISTSQAGNAKLAGTTSALIAVMNSYKFSADQAGFASNVLTRVVGMGVGTMDEFASALPQVTGLANSLGIGFDDLGAMTAYLSTQGNTAAQSTTQLAAMMTALLNPNESMKKGLQELGFTSGQAAIEALGLTGAYQALAGTQTANAEGMAKMSGSVEALRGITALTGPDVAAFLATFKSGIEGATAAAEAVQMGSAAAQFDLLKSKVSELGINLGNVLMPILIDLVTKAKPVVDEVIRWIGKNPELTKQILLLTGGLIIAGPIIALVGTGISIMGGAAKIASSAAGLLSSKMFLAIAPVLAVGVAIAGVILQLQEFQRIAGEAARSAGAAAAPALSNPAITRAQVAGAMFGELQKQYGDLGARLIMGSGSLNVDNLIDEYMKAGGNPNAGTGAFQGWGAGQPATQDNGGMGMAGMPYMIGRGAQPELFVPSSSGTFYPNADRMMGSGITITGNVIVYANNPADFQAQLEAEARRRGA